MSSQESFYGRDARLRRMSSYSESIPVRSTWSPLFFAVLPCLMSFAVGSELGLDIVVCGLTIFFVYKAATRPEHAYKRAVAQRLNAAAITREERIAHERDEKVPLRDFSTELQRLRGIEHRCLMFTLIAPLVGGGIIHGMTMVSLGPLMRQFNIPLFVLVASLQPWLRWLRTTEDDAEQLVGGINERRGGVSIRDLDEIYAQMDSLNHENTMLRTKLEEIVKMVKSYRRATDLKSRSSERELHNKLEMLSSKVETEEARSFRSALRRSREMTWRSLLQRRLPLGSRITTFMCLLFNQIAWIFGLGVIPFVNAQQSKSGNSTPAIAKACSASDSVGSDHESHASTPRLHSDSDDLCKA